MARGHQVVRGRSGSVHNKEWTATCAASTVMDIAIGTLVAFNMFVADEAETILRTRGRVMAHFDPASVNESVTVAVGLAVVSARAVAAGAASLPRPATEGAYPWLWHGWLMMDSFAVQILEASASPAWVDRLEIDSKAMRKVKETEVVALVFEICDSLDGGGSVIIKAGVRALTGD